MYIIVGGFKIKDCSSAPTPTPGRFPRYRLNSHCKPLPPFKTIYSNITTKLAGLGLRPEVTKPGNTPKAQHCPIWLAKWVRLEKECLS